MPTTDTPHQTWPQISMDSPALRSYSLSGRRGGRIVFLGRTPSLRYSEDSRLRDGNTRIFGLPQTSAFSSKGAGLVHWQHVMLGTRCSWLHGDRRGFRDRGHRTHSSGDYKSPPPESEHAPMRRYYEKRSQKRVDFDLEVRVQVCSEFVQKMLKLGFRIIACSCSKRHLHALVELVSEYHEKRKVIGKCKQKASQAVRLLLPGNIWSEGGEFKRINDAGHLENTYDYIRTKQEPGTIVWSHKADEDWIKDASLGIVMMGRAKKQTRVFGLPQTPASGL